MLMNAFMPPSEMAAIRFGPEARLASARISVQRRTNPRSRRSSADFQMPMRREIFKKREGIVVQFIVRCINKCRVTLFNDVEQLGHGLVAVRELGPVARPKFRPTLRIVTKPFA